MLKKTEVQGIMSAGPGILVNTESSDYMNLRQKMINEKKQKDQISALESDVNEIKNTLKQILNLINK